MKKLCTKKKKSKGKIHPSPSHSPTPSLAALNLLPSAFLTLVTATLSADDQEVLVYLILRSLDATNPSSSSPSTATTTCKLKCKKPTAFYCGCFDCYTRFWIRWDSSPNRHLIHDAIDAFDDQLSLSDHPNKTQQPNNPKPTTSSSSDKNSLSETVSAGPKLETSKTVSSISSSSACAATAAVADNAGECVDGEEQLTGNRLQPVASVQQKVLARKVWPDMLGIFNSRLWSLWSTNA